MITSSRH